MPAASASRSVGNERLIRISRGSDEVGAVLLERLQDLQVVLVGRAALGQDLELELVVGHVRTLPYPV